MPSKVSTDSTVTWDQATQVSDLQEAWKWPKGLFRIWTYIFVKAKIFITKPKPSWLGLNLKDENLQFNAKNENQYWVIL